MRMVTLGAQQHYGEVIMDARLQMEISPGTICITQCNKCGNEAIQFDAVAIDAIGVGFVGTILKCPSCERPPTS